MFKRKLLALEYQDPNADFSDVDTCRKFVVWLENQKIRHYKIEDRGGLSDINSSGWDAAFEKYLKDLGCPTPVSDRNPMLDWLIGLAIRLEYGENPDKYRPVPKKDTELGDMAAPSNPLEALDFNSADFKAGVASLAQLLQIPAHPDHLLVLQAICLLVQQRLSSAAIEKAQKESIRPAGVSIPLDKIELGFEVSDPTMAQAAKILRLLHIRDLRELQDLANEAIVSVQALTANPKTDTLLGKVGKS